MPVRDEVRRTQRSLEALGAAHLRATTRLDQARVWRAEVLADADVAVAAPQDVVEAAVVDMAGSTGVELTAETPGVGAGDGNQRWSSGPAGSSRRPDHRCPAGVPNVPRPGWGADQ
jgi:hypothetical protein